MRLGSLIEAYLLLPQKCHRANTTRGISRSMTSCLLWLADVYRKLYLDIPSIFPAGLRTFDHNNNIFSILQAAFPVRVDA
jgi:hypothetical protein